MNARPATVEARPSCAAAALAVVEAIAANAMIGDAELEALVAARPDDAARKRLISGLYACCLINREQAGMQVYLRPGLRSA